MIGYVFHTPLSTDRGFAGIHQIIGLHTKDKYHLRTHSSEMKTKHHSESYQLTDEIFFLLTLIIGRQQDVGVKANQVNRKVNGEGETFLNSLNLQEKNSCFK